MLIGQPGFIEDEAVAQRASMRDARFDSMRAGVAACAAMRDFIDGSEPDAELGFEELGDAVETGG